PSWPIQRHLSAPARFSGVPAPPQTQFAHAAAQPGVAQLVEYHSGNQFLCCLLLEFASRHLQIQEALCEVENCQSVTLPCQRLQWLPHQLGVQSSGGPPIPCAWDRES